MILLVGAGLMLNSFLRLQRVNPVINTGNLLSVKINLPKTRYSDSTMAARFFQELIHKVEVLPGVNSTSLSTVQPLSEVATNDPFVIEGRPLVEQAVAAADSLGAALIRGLQSGGIAACGKHFPGHGDTDSDSHHHLPRLKHTLERRVVEHVDRQPCTEGSCPSGEFCEGGYCVPFIP